MTATRTDYDVWRCAKCKSEKTQPSLPHEPPQCCGTGMWWQRFEQGKPYTVDLSPEQP